MPVVACSTSMNGSAWTDIPERDIKLRRGDDVVLRIIARDRATRELIDWTGWTFASKAKPGVDTVTATVTHDGTGGTITVVFPKAQTSLLTPDDTGRWDLEGTDPLSMVKTVVEGDVLVTADVT
jgi:hypothetical protein